MLKHFFAVAFLFVALFPVHAMATFGDVSPLATKIRTLDIQGVTIDTPIGDIKQILEQQGYILQDGRDIHAFQYQRLDAGGVHIVSVAVSPAGVNAPAQEGQYPKQLAYGYMYQEKRIRDWEKLPVTDDIWRVTHTICDRIVTDDDMKKNPDLYGVFSGRYPGCTRNVNNPHLKNIKIKTPSVMERDDDPTLFVYSLEMEAKEQRYNLVVRAFTQDGKPR